jgi:3-hydroxybutyryl-CoA dehydrogenase
VVGAGTMGVGIAQVALEAGDAVRLYDPAADARKRGRERIVEGLVRRAAKSRSAADSIDTWVEVRLARLEVLDDLETTSIGAGMVVEAVVEDLDVKRQLFGRLDDLVSPDAILATNTSALRVADIASATKRPARVLGLHFFNPAPLMALVEVVATPKTDEEVVARAMATVHRWGKTPVRSADSPGFIVNRVNRPFTLEALRMLETGAATIEEIDAAVVTAGFPMGPFALMDLIGIDINLAAARGVFEGFGGAAVSDAARFRPSSTQERLVAEGRLGRKTGEGFYRYGATGKPAGPSAGFAGASGRVRQQPADIVGRIITAIVAEAGRALADGVASADDIDLAMRLGAGHPRGPFEWVARATIRP